MAHWAQIDENNKVIRVTVGDNNDPDEGYQWLVDNVGGTWIKTSYNSHGGIHYSNEYESYTVEEEGKLVTRSRRLPSGNAHLRYNYAGIGYTYDEDRDAFIPPKPEIGDWILNEETCLWKEVTD